MRKIILSVLLILCMLLGLLPATAIAGTSYDLYVGGTNVTDYTHSISYWKADDGGAYSETGTEYDYDFSVSFDSDAESFTLTLNGVDIVAQYHNSDGIYSNAGLNVILTEGTENIITAGYPGGITAYNDLNISGEGSLSITQIGTNYGIASDSGNVEIASPVTINQSGIGIYANGIVTIDGPVVARGSETGVSANEVKIVSGSLTASSDGHCLDAIRYGYVEPISSGFLSYRTNSEPSAPAGGWAIVNGSESEVINIPASGNNKYFEVFYCHGVYLANVNISSSGEETYWLNDGEGGITPTGADADNYNAKYDNVSNTLTLNDLAITNSYNYSGNESLGIDGESYGIYSSGTLNIVLADGTYNTINTASSNNRICINVKTESNITVGGGGALSLHAEPRLDEGSCTTGILSGGDITVTGGATTVTAEYTDCICGFYAASNGDITVGGGSVFIDTNTAWSDGTGISTGNGNITISGGTVIALADDSEYSGYGLCSYEGRIDITGGAVYATGDGNNIGQSAAISAGGGITPGAYDGSYDKASVIMTLADGDSYTPTLLYNSSSIPEFDASNDVVFTGGFPFGYGESWYTETDKVYGNFDASSEHNYTWSGKHNPGDDIPGDDVFDLTLNGLDIAGYSDNERGISTNYGLNLMLKGENSIGTMTNPFDSGMYCADNMTVSAENGGSLAIIATDAGINSDGAVSFESGTISVITDRTGIQISNGGMTISGGNVTISAGDVGIQTDNTCDVIVSGSETVLDITAGEKDALDEFYGIRCKDGIVEIDDATVIIETLGKCGDGVWAKNDIRISGDAQVEIIDWSLRDIVKCGLHSQYGNIAIGDSSNVDIVSQSTGIYTKYDGSVYLGYVWDGTSYTPSGSPTVKINDAGSIAAVTPLIYDDFIAGPYGIHSDSGIRVAGGSVTALGTEQALRTVGEGSSINVNMPAYKHRSNTAAAVPTMPFLYYPGTSFDVSSAGNYKYVNITSTFVITGAESQNGSFTVTVDGVPVSAAEQGDTVTLTAEPEEGFSFVSWSVYRTDDTTTTCPVDNNMFTMPAYPVTILASFAAPPVINPVLYNYDLNYPGDVTATITWNNATSVTDAVYSIRPDTTVYTLGAGDYNIDDDVLTIESSFLSGISLTSGASLAFVFTFNTGDEATLTVNAVEGFVPITGITGVPNTVMEGTPLTLTGTVTPGNATNQTITWSVYNTGNTGASIVGNILSTTGAGVAVVRATIENGLTSGSDYIQDFNITVSAAPITTHTVIFNSNGVVYDTKTVNDGESIGYAAWSANPTKSNYTFGGWFTGENGAGTQFTSETPVNADMTVYAKWTYTGGGGGGGGGNNTPKPPKKTITVTETSCKVFQNAAGSITAEADVEDAFSNSVEVKVTDTPEDAASFKISAGDEVYPFDISLYIKGTDNKTEPSPGYAVTISLPIPDSLVDKREALTVVHKADDGTVTTLQSRLTQKNGVWYLVFNATEFSPYALVVRKARSYDEPAGVPYYLDVSGKKVFIGFAANGKYIAPEGVSVSVTQNDKSFTDISGHWAAEYIGFVTEREIFVGTGSNVFSPDTGMTRAMFATVIGRLYERSYGEIETSDTQAFTDCNYDAYYGKYIAWASESGIIGGYGNGRFGPDDQITREQMASILYRFADFLGILPGSMDTLLDYPDADSISGYAKTAALYCQTTGVIGGRTCGVFAPQETATRAEVATIIQRFVEMVVK